ncbi:MAG: spore coat protein U domain-containing protein [Polaromonas sp.]|nr:spore coat protein U domain-containing protein [Polaromonas sp.]
MKRFLFKLLPITGMLIACGSVHAVTCTIAVTSLTTIAFDPTTALQLTGTVSGSCTPTTPQEASSALPTIYIGINAGGRTPRSMIRSGGVDLVTYQINKSAGAGIWNEATGTTVLTTDGGLLFTMAAGTKNTAQPYSRTFYLNIPAQPTDPVGTYNDATITATIRQTSAAGTSLGTTTFGLTATIAPFCSFSTSPSTLNLNYTSFTTTAATGTSAFSLNCTSGTSYSQAVSPATGTALGVSYSLALSATTGLTGNAAAQNYTVTGTAAAGQSGTCATSGALCSANNPHTITVTF